MLYVTSECPHCIKIKPQVFEINNILKKANPDLIIKISNIKDLDHYKVKFEKTVIQLGIGNTPHLIIAKIIHGKIVEDINIQGSYVEECFKPTIFGYLNDELKEYQDYYENVEMGEE